MKKQKLNKGLHFKKTSVSDLNSMNGGAEIKTLPIFACKLEPVSRAAQNTCQFSCAHNDAPSCRWSQCC